LDEGEVVEIWEAEQINYNASSFLDVDSILDMMDTNASEECLEWSEGWMDNLNDIEKKSFDEMLCKAVDKWAKKHKKEPTFFTAGNPKLIKVRIHEDDYEILKDPACTDA